MEIVIALLVVIFTVAAVASLENHQGSQERKCNCNGYCNTDHAGRDCERYKDGQWSYCRECDLGWYRQLLAEEEILDEKEMREH